MDKIRQLDCEIGSYKWKEEIVSQDSLALYIHPNPRDMKKATFDVMKNCVDLVQRDEKYNIDVEVLNCIQKSKGKSHFCDFDIDTKEIYLNKMKDILSDDSYDIIETRGGYHILVNTRLALKMQWYQKITKVFEVDQIGDQLLPVCGCWQGGFTPKFVYV